MNSLRLKIFWMVFVVVAAAVVTVSVVAGQGTATAVQEVVFFSAQRDQHLAAELLTSGIVASRGGAPIGAEEVQARVETLGAVMGTDILLLDPAGRVLVDSANWRTGQALLVPPEWPGPADPWVQVADEPAFVVLGYPPAIASFRVAAAGAPVTDTVMFFGPGEAALAPPATFTRSVGPPSILAASILSNFNRTLLLAAVAGGGVALVLTGVLSRGIVRPVESLTRAARRMERGDREQRVVVGSRDEIGALAQAFNAMADSVSQAEQLRRQMVNDIAHELRTPLTNIRGYLEAVRDGLLEPRPAVIASLHEEALLLNRLVGDLQELALAEAGQLTLTTQPTALADVVAKTLDAWRPRLAGGPELCVDVPDTLPLVSADPARIGQVLRNLLENARQHTPPDGTITISARAAADAVEVAVSDTGSGIAPEHLPNVFERFYRADPSRARATGGAGLGLAIVRQLVEAHGGRVSVRSEAGTGTTFVLTLPYEQPPTDP